MTASTDLKVAVTALSATVGTLNARVTALHNVVPTVVAALKAANPNDPEVVAAVTALQALNVTIGQQHATIDSDTGVLNSALPLP
jgi:outer membrane murein-binding lipoprotein Lpp